MSVRFRWVLVAVVLVVATAVAFWPRDSGTPQATPPPRPTADIAAARAKAGLSPCPTGHGTVPAFRGVTASCLGDGRPVDLGTALAGHTTVLNVWATWCAPCQGELPVLAQYAARPGAAQVLTVQTRSDPADGLNLLASLHVRLPAVTDTGQVGKALNLPPALPASYVVRPDGTVHKVNDPLVFQSADQVAAAVAGDAA